MRNCLRAPCTRSHATGDLSETSQHKDPRKHSRTYQFSSMFLRARIRRAWPACVMRALQLSASHKRTGPLLQRLKTRRTLGPSAPRCKRTGQNPDGTRKPRFATPRMVDARPPKSLRKSACPHPPDDPKMTGGCRTPKKPEKERMSASTRRPKNDWWMPDPQKA